MGSLEKEKAEHLSCGVAETIGSAKDRAGEFASNAKAKVNAFTSRLGRRVKQLGYNMRARCPHETIHDVTNKVADRLETAGDYLERKDVKWFLYDVGSFIRRYPISSLAVGVGIGFLLARRR
jgi:ElaB/YqjD/DUF883 family membrane-anchored ribosome-binding protein